jgi:hypothetical protein
MKALLVLVLIVHSLIHLMGAAKAWRLAELPQLTQPISKSMGLLWLAAALLVVATSGALFGLPQSWWLLGAVALVVSQAVILTAWQDAKFGTVANVVLLVAVVLGYLKGWPVDE